VAVDALVAARYAVFDPRGTQMAPDAATTLLRAGVPVAVDVSWPSWCGPHSVRFANIRRGGLGLGPIMSPKA
jgi:hypothetical protein